MLAVGEGEREVVRVITVYLATVVLQEQDRLRYQHVDLPPERAAGQHHVRLRGILLQQHQKCQEAPSLSAPQVRKLRLSVGLQQSQGQGEVIREEREMGQVLAGQAHPVGEEVNRHQGKGSRQADQIT